jgi:hypothetical protein
MNTLAGLLFFVFFMLPGQIPEAAVIGPIKGLVERLDLRKNKWEKVRQGDSILKDDRIRTGRNSRAELVFKNKIYLRASANSEINVRSLFSDTKEQDLDVNFNPWEPCGTSAFKEIEKKKSRFKDSVPPGCL